MPITLQPRHSGWGSWELHKLNQLSLAYASFGNALIYGEESPMGTDGRAYFIRLTYKH
jgi:hypothetical protein